VHVDEAGAPLVGLDLVTRILAKAGSPYFHEAALLNFFSRVFEIPPLRLVV